MEKFGHCLFTEIPSLLLFLKIVLVAALDHGEGRRKIFKGSSHLEPHPCDTSTAEISVRLLGTLFITRT